jgi:hypothetical protein
MIYRAVKAIARIERIEYCIEAMRDIKVKGKSMHWKPIKKSCDTWILQPNLLDYDKTCANFSWEAIRRELDGLPGGKGLNIAYEAIDRHAIGPLCDHLAIRWLGKDSTVLDFTYGDLKEHSCPLYCCTRHIQEHECLLSLILRFRSGPNLPTVKQGRCPCPGDHREPI